MGISEAEEFAIVWDVKGEMTDFLFCFVFCEFSGDNDDD